MKWHAGIALAVMLGGLGACAGDPPGPGQPPVHGLIVSDPTSTASSSAGMLAPPASTAGDEVTYVSLPPGTVPTGGTAAIRRVGDSGSIVTAVFNGGFDPVPVNAAAGDSIDVIVRDAVGGTVLQTRLLVAARRPPVVVRTNPPRKRKDVPLNAAIVIVFSEPVAGSSLTAATMQLFRGTSAIPGTIQVLQGTGAAAAFVPAAPLATNTTYNLEIRSGIQDLEGDGLAAAISVEFTTGQSSTGPAASILVSPDSAFLPETGATYQMTATVRDAAGNELIDQPVTWSSSDSAGLTVSPTGLLTALAAGGYFVGARVGALEAFAVVIVSGPSGPVLPAAPTGVNAAPSPFGIDVTWTDNATDETGFRVERAATAAGPWTLAATTGENVTRLLHRQSPGDDQAVCYRVFAVNGVGSSDASAEDCTAAPTPPTNLAASSASDGAVNLTWSDNSNVEDGYQVLRSSSHGEGGAVVATLPANTTSYRDVGLADSSYGYNVRATKDGGSTQHSLFAQVVVATVPPSAPTNAEAVPAGSSVVGVSWMDMAMNEDSTRVEHTLDGGATWTTVATVGWYRWRQNPDGAASFEQSEQPVCYRVIAFNRIGDSPASNTDCTTPPAGPTQFTAIGVDSVTVDLAWTDNSGVEDGYVIARFVDYGDGYSEWQYLATVGANATSYRLEGYPPTPSETYGVAALKDGGTSDWATAAPAPTPVRRR